ncbi:MAG TPA: polysaccharide biosynthesis protein, partial [Gammaproteobacteria bacterium]|nr:polysaccharide biosynthesis protein [Gammaproteobacteria bacterium]
LAEQLIRLSGRKPGQDIKIIYTGLRPGEKLYEELFHEEENLDKTEIDKIMLAKSRKVNWNKLCTTISQLEKETYSFDEDALRETMKKLVPEQLPAGGHDDKPNKVSLRVINNG